MTEFPDLHYLTQVSFKLERFKVVSTNPAKINFRCHLCGDSKKSKTKARGWILENREHQLHFFCHNCGASQSFRKFLQVVDIATYNNYITDRFSRKEAPPKAILEKTKCEAPVFETSPLIKIKKLSALDPTHPAREYVNSRQIPKEQQSRIYYAPKFIQWINSILPNKFDEKKVKDEPRLILPFIDQKGTLFGVSARSFDPNGLRYISIMFDQNMPKIFGLNKVDFTKTYYVVEGAIDSLFIPNAVAMAGADGNMHGLEHLENSITVFDNESRNAEIHKRMEKVIRAGNKICIWPSNIAQKDINEMFLAGVKNIDKLIEENSFSGLEASIRLTSWRKV